MSLKNSHSTKHHFIWNLSSPSLSLVSHSFFSAALTNKSSAVSVFLDTKTKVAETFVGKKDGRQPPYKSKVVTWSDMSLWVSIRLLSIENLSSKDFLAGRELQFNDLGQKNYYWSQRVNPKWPSEKLNVNKKHNLHR